MSPSGSGAWSGGQLMMASPEGSSASDIATNRVFWISSIRTDSNSVDLVASWSEGLLATGSVIDVWGKFGSLAVDWAFLANREVLAEDGTNALITVRLPEERPSAAFFALATDADADGQWWRIEEECRVAGAETNAWTQMKIRLTGLSDSLRSETELWRDGERVSRAVTSFDPVTALLTEDREDAQTGVSRTKSRYGRELETEARDGRTCRYFSPLGEEFSQWRTNPSTGAMSPNVLTEVNGCGDVIERATCWKKTDVHLTEYDHDCRGNVTNETNAVGESVIRRYGPDGELLSETGDAYPVSFASDSSLRRTALSTTRDGTLHDTTGWSYDFQTGLCTNKTYADGSCVAYTHTPDGLPLRTTAPDGSWWENVYDTGRRPVARASSDPSCAASYDLDPFGRIVSVTSPSASYGYSLAANGVATNETATLGGVSAEIRRGLDRVGRLTSLSVGGSSDWTFAYADSGLLAVLSNADVRVDYAYDRNANDVGYVLTLAGGATFERRLTRHSYLRGEVTKVTNVCGAESNEIAYAYDALQRPVSRNADMFAYNRRGEVASATVAGEPSAYAYDFIGNATSVTVDGATTTYAANALNQYETVAEPDATLEPAYTPNGELAAFGPWTYAYDALSRLTEVRSNGVLVASNSYDHLGRRVRLVTQTAAHTFIYDGWNVVLELVEQGGVTDRIEYYWGKDISGSLQGAGGVGGLLYLKRNGSIFVPIYDAYGNVMEYRAADGSLAASYVYDAFGRTILQTGSLADVFRFRYSTKSFERESGLYYYGCRYYHPLLRKWLSRDPRGVAGGLNLYCFCRNIPVGLYDYLGQTSVSISMSVGEQDSFAGKLMFLDIAVTVNEPPEGDGFLTFIQLKKPEGQEWSLDNRGEIGPYYYSRINLGKWSGKDDAGHEVLHLYDAPGGATTAPSSFYVAVVEVQRSCSGTVPKIKCYDKVTLIDSRTWTYQPLSANHYSYENESRGKGMIPRLRDLIGNIKWGCEICSDLKVEISK